MRKISVKILVISVLTLFFGISNSWGQSEKDKIDALIQKKRTFNKENNNTVVYKIQLFNGNETEALKVREEFEKEFPEYKTILLYRAPEWKTQVGLFKTRLEADKALLRIRKEFAGAIVLEDKV